jgi:hypothetical protein
MTIDLERCRRAMKHLRIEGRARPAVIEEAIRRIQENGETALMREYFGVKNYAGFGDQREDHEYGFGPKHGTIVFRIERTDAARKPAVTLGADEVYLLECYRDFEPVQFKEWANGRTELVTYHLCAAIRKRDQLAADTKQFDDALDRCLVDVH